MLYRALAILALSIPLPACTTLQQGNRVETVKAETRKVCAVAGQVFGWTLIDTGIVDETVPSFQRISLDDARVKTRKACVIAGQLFGWEIVDVPLATAPQS